jgi:hypothetical protein
MSKRVWGALSTKSLGRSLPEKSSSRFAAPAFLSKYITRKKKASIVTLSFVTL